MSSHHPAHLAKEARRRRQRRWIIAIAALALLSAFVVAATRERDAGAQRRVEQYLAILADGGPTPLADLIGDSDGYDLDELDAADRLLAGATERIDDVRLGGAEHDADVDSVFSGSFERYVAYDVDYTLAGEKHTGRVGLGLSQDGDADSPDDWRVVLPLGGEVDTETSGWAGARVDVSIASVGVTDRDRYLDDRAPTDAQRWLHAGVYPVRVQVGDLFAADSSLAVTEDVRTVPAEGLTATDAGLVAVRAAVDDAFATCSLDAADCPAAALVRRQVPASDWWRGLVAPPSVGIDDDAVTLTGSFRYRTTGGQERTQAFTGTGSMRITAAAGGPVVTVTGLTKK